MLTETPIQNEATTTQSVAFELSGVKRTYMRDSVAVEALRGIDLTIHSGEYLVIEGPSGSGKSTLLQLLGMLDKPSDGTVSCDGVPTGDLSEPELAELRLKKIGFIFQQFNLIPTLTAKQNVEIAMFPTDRSKSESTTRALELLAKVGLADRADHFPSQLSGGEQQRVAIARALANEPEILLADEPTGNLDTQTGNEILATIRQLWSAGLTVVLITHDRSIADEATRTLILRDGAIATAEDEPTS